MKLHVVVLPPALPDQNIANKSNWLDFFCLFSVCLCFRLLARKIKGVDLWEIYWRKTVDIY